MLFEASSGDSIGENKKRALVRDLFLETFQQKIVLVIEHCPEPLPADVAVRRAVNCVAERHVVSRHRFGNRSGRAADMKKSPRHFLARADLGERSALLAI